MHCFQRALGLMSGTSLDGVDAALVLTDGQEVAAQGASLTLAYDPPFRAALRAILGSSEDSAEVRAVERELTLIHAQAVRALLDKAHLKPGDVDVVGFHGHTILHRPAEGRTWQIGDGALLAREIGIPVVNDFRTADVAAGGQGAPLVPVVHQALAAHLEKPVAILNLGGVGNLTWLGEGGAILAFDTGPGNALIDDWALKHTGRPVDEHGALALAGRANPERVAEFAAHPYFAARPPKSLDRDDFRHFAEGLVANLPATHGAATLTAFTAEAVAQAVPHLPERPKRWLVCGGGRLNPAIMAELAARLGVPVEQVDLEGWDGDALEAQAFAVLAIRSLKGLPLTFPTTTGCPRPVGGGVLHQP